MPTTVPVIWDSNMAVPDIGERVRALELLVAVLTERIDAARTALRLQATENERRLDALNNEYARINLILATTVSAEKFDTYEKAQSEAVDLAAATAAVSDERLHARISVLENWRAKAIGAGTLMMLLSGTMGAAVMRILGG